MIPLVIITVLTLGVLFLTLKRIKKDSSQTFEKGEEVCLLSPLKGKITQLGKSKAQVYIPSQGLIWKPLSQILKAWN